MTDSDLAPSITFGFLLYILLFGIGSILGIVLVGLAITMPLIVSSSWGRSSQPAFQGLASVGSVVMGLTILYRVGIGGKVF